MTNKTSNNTLGIAVTYVYLEHNWEKNYPLQDVINETYGAFLDMKAEDLKVRVRDRDIVGVLADSQGNSFDLSSQQPNAPFWYLRSHQLLLLGIY